MLRSYFKVAFRNLVNSKVYSFINIAGLATGMAVALLIGLWLQDELSFNKSVKNYDRISQVWQFVKFDAEKTSFNVLPAPLAAELRQKYPDIKSVSLSAEHEAVISTGHKKLSEKGNYVEPDFADLMSLDMVSGNQNGLNDPHSILLSEGLAKLLFADQDPMNQVIHFNDTTVVKITGICRDFPSNTSFKDVSYLAPWALFEANGKKFARPLK